MGQHCTDEPYAMFPERLQTTGKIMCNVVPEAPNNVAQEKNPGNVMWTTSGYFIYIIILGPSHQKKYITKY